MSRQRSVLGALLLASLLVVVALVAGRPATRDGRVLSPESTAPDGARGLVDVLDALGGDVEVVTGAPPEEAATAVLLDDRLVDDDRARLAAWVEAGGTLLVGDPSSPLATPSSDAARCPDALADVNVIVPPGGAGADGAVSCPDIDVDVHAVGRGWVVTVRAGPTPFTNLYLGDGDNAVLAASVLVPAGDERVAFLDGTPGGGELTLFDLVPTDVRQAVVQLGVAFVLLVLWAGRRLGPPVVEHQPVAVEGAELVAAVGRLLDGRHRPDEAAATLRADARRSLELQLGLGPTTPPDDLAAAVHARTGLDPSHVVAAVATRPVRTDADLVAVAADLDHIRRSSLGGDS